jgi:hypothetical protein
MGRCNDRQPGAKEEKIMRSSFKSLKEKQIPNRANPLDTFWSTDTHKVFVAVGGGEVLCLSDLIQFGTGKALLIGPEGPAGAACVCKVGKDGKDGRDGKDGQPGRDGATIVGPPGLTGAAGADGRPAPERAEVDALKIEHEREIKKLRQEFAALKADFDGIISMNKKSAEYLEFLRAKAAARRAS